MYEKTVKLRDNETLQKVNIETGEIVDLPSSPEPRNGMLKFDLMSSYSRRNTKAWVLLASQTNDKEYIVANKLADMARAYTSSLIPLTPDSTVSEMYSILGEDRRKISGIIDKLFRLGVIGKFEVYDKNELHHNYWIFNPYLSFNGKVIKSDVATLFSGTFYAFV